MQAKNSADGLCALVFGLWALRQRARSKEQRAENRRQSAGSSRQEQVNNRHVTDLKRQMLYDIFPFVLATARNDDLKVINHSADG